LLKKQTAIQQLTQDVALQNQYFNQQTEIINTGASVAQKYGPPILRDMGYYAAKNKNEKLKALLVKQKLENFIPNDEQLKQMDESRAKQGQAGKEPAPATKPPASSAPAASPAPETSPAPTAPALRPGSNR
jgi:hypothetical protein